MPKTTATIKIENVVASATLNQKVDLNAVVKSYPGVEYRPEQFPGLVFRLKRPKTATLIFNSGKMVCTGAKSEKEARRAVKKVIKELKKGGIIIISKPELKIQNIVASASLGGRIDLESATLSLGKTMYEPEQFPGAILRIQEPKLTLLLFKNGKMICAGAKRETLLKKGLRKAAKLIRGRYTRLHPSLHERRAEVPLGAVGENGGDVPFHFVSQLPCSPDVGAR